MQRMRQPSRRPAPSHLADVFDHELPSLDVFRRTQAPAALVRLERLQRRALPLLDAAVPTPGADVARVVGGDSPRVGRQSRGLIHVHAVPNACNAEGTVQTVLAALLGAAAQGTLRLFGLHLRQVHVLADHGERRRLAVDLIDDPARRQDANQRG